MENLKEFVKAQLGATKIPLSVICREADVPYSATYYFKTKGSDMRSEYIQKLYTYFTTESTK